MSDGRMRKSLLLLAALFLGSGCGVFGAYWHATHHSVWTDAAPLAVTHGVAKAVSTTADAHLTAKAPNE